jgi:archaellum component FlaC
MNEQQKEYSKLQEQYSNNDSANKDADELNARYKKIEHKCMQLEEQLESQRNINKETSSKLLDLKRKHKVLDELHTKMKNSVIPKVNATKEY